MKVNSPVDVSDVEDLTGPACEATNFRVVPHELDQNRSLAEIGAHGEIGYGSNQGDASGDVVEQTVSARLGEGVTHESKGGHRHDSADGKIPVTTVSGDSDGLHPTDAIVDVESLVARHDEKCLQSMLDTMRCGRKMIRDGDNGRLLMR